MVLFFDSFHNIFPNDILNNLKFIKIIIFLTYFTGLCDQTDLQYLYLLQLQLNSFHL